MDETIQVGELSPSFEDDVGRSLADYTIAFIVERAGQDPDLLGTGILVQVEDVRAILTAHHVIHRLSRTGRLAVLLGPTNQAHTIDTAGAQFLEIARGRVDAEGPDLGAAVLASTIASAIAAKKSFYNLTPHRARALHSPPPLDDGVWVANGFLAERSMTIEEPDGRSVKGFYHFSAFGGPEVSPKVGEYDYFEYPVTLESRPGAPERWGGMSGGGLWQVPLKREGGSLWYPGPHSSQASSSTNIPPHRQLAGCGLMVARASIEWHTTGSGDFEGHRAHSAGPTGVPSPLEIVRSGGISAVARPRR